MSGIYIPGLEMPKKDGALCIVIHHDGKVCHFFDLQGERIATAAPVPEHGRLIDALWVREQIIKQWMDYSDDSHMYKRGMEDAYEVIRNAPTIIPADKEGEG